LSDRDPAQLVSTLIAEAEGKPCDQGELRDLLGMKAACEGAIKAGDPMDLEQMQELLDALADTWSPSICPHGRPALVSIALEELARRFGR
jgi:DNA mismatch repair protein MutL